MSNIGEFEGEYDYYFTGGARRRPGRPRKSRSRRKSRRGPGRPRKSRSRRTSRRGPGRPRKSRSRRRSRSRSRSRAAKRACRTSRGRFTKCGGKSRKRSRTRSRRGPGRPRKSRSRRKSRRGPGRPRKSRSRRRSRRGPGRPRGSRSRRRSRSVSSRYLRTGGDDWKSLMAMRLMAKNMRLRRAASTVQASPKVAAQIGPRGAVQPGLVRQLKPTGTGRCERLGLVTCPDNQCATKRANCN